MYIYIHTCFTSETRYNTHIVRIYTRFTSDTRRQGPATIRHQAFLKFEASHLCKLSQYSSSEKTLKHTTRDWQACKGSRCTDSNCKAEPSLDKSEDFNLVYVRAWVFSIMAKGLYNYMNPCKCVLKSEVLLARDCHVFLQCYARFVASCGSWQSVVRFIWFAQSAW
jgi:hypothetical protein